MKNSEISDSKNEQDDNQINLSNSSEISKIDLKSQSINSSLKENLSKTEEYIQKDILLVMDCDSVNYIFLIQ